MNTKRNHNTQTQHKHTNYTTNNNNLQTTNKHTKQQQWKQQPTPKQLDSTRWYSGEDIEMRRRGGGRKEGRKDGRKEVGQTGINQKTTHRGSGMTSLCSTTSTLSNYNCSHGKTARYCDCDGFVNLEKLEHNQHIGATGPWNGREETGGRGDAPGGNWSQNWKRRSAADKPINWRDPCAKDKASPWNNMLIVRMTKTKTKKASE